VTVSRSNYLWVAVVLLVLVCLAFAAPPVLSQEPPPNYAGPVYRAGFTGALTSAGLRIDTILLDGPATRAGLQPGDVIVQIEGNGVSGDHECLRHLDSTTRHVRLVVRNYETGTLALVTLDLAPPVVKF
jgi:S1-C subfamily serine protease